MKLCVGHTGQKLFLGFRLHLVFRGRNIASAVRPAGDCREARTLTTESEQVDDFWFRTVSGQRGNPVDAFGVQESLILAQDERWRRALCMQVER